MRKLITKASQFTLIALKSYGHEKNSLYAITNNKEMFPHYGVSYSFLVDMGIDSTNLKNRCCEVIEDSE